MQVVLTGIHGDKSIFFLALTRGGATSRLRIEVPDGSPKTANKVAHSVAVSLRMGVKEEKIIAKLVLKELYRLGMGLQPLTAEMTPEGEFEPPAVLGVTVTLLQD